MELSPLIARFRGPLIGLLHAWGAQPADAVEIAQDVFAEAYVGRDRFRGSWENDGEVGAWLRGIAMNLHRSRSRKVGRTEPLGEREFEQPREEPEPEAASEVRAAIDRLRGQWKTVLLMYYVEKSGLAEIAALLGITERAVEGRLHRARNELKARLAPERSPEGQA